MKLFLSVFFAVCFLTTSSWAQWTQVNNNLGSLNVTGLARIGTTIYAGTSDKGLFISADNGASWSAYADNASLPSLAINGLEGDPLTALGISIYTQNGFAILQSTLAVLPVQTLPNKDITLYRQYSGPTRRLVGTKNSGLYYTDDDVNWIEATGIPAGPTKNIRGIMSDDANTLIIGGTENGAGMSTDRGSSWTDANAGLSGDAMKINSMFAFFALTANGIYYTSLTAFTGWNPVVSTGDYRACTADITTMQYYFFGKDVATSANLTTSQIGSITLGGISGGAVTSAVLYGNYIFVGTETGGVFRAQLSALTDVTERNEALKTFSLSQNYPNPFNPSTTIEFGVPFAGNVSITVYNVLGKEVATLVNKELPAGNHAVNFDASTLTSGIYFYRLKVGNFVETKRMMLLK